MKLEYLHDISANGKFKDVVSKKLIRLWDFDQIESKQFQELIADFVNDTQKEELVLNEQNFIKPLNCNLTLVKDRLNNGISRVDDEDFICKLNNEGYKNMIDLIQPFVNEDSGGYQWLDEKADVGEIDFLFSPGGSW